MQPEFEAYWNLNLIKHQQTKLHFQPSERNKHPILETLQQHIDHSSSGNFLEISSGSGQHVAFIAPKFPSLTFQPTEYEERYCASISEYIRDENLSNVRQPFKLDVSQSVEFWGNGSLLPCSVDFVLNVNLTHVAPFLCTEGLFKGCSVLLKPNGLLFTYGPFAFNGVINPTSNVEFDRALRAHDPNWGLRDVERELKPLGLQFGIHLTHVHDLPANNKMLVWRKTLVSE